MFINDFLPNKKAISEGFGDTVGDTVQKIATKVGDKLANALPKDMQPFNNDTAAKNYASLKPAKEPVKEQKQSVNDYDTWSDQVAAQGGEVHPQKDRVRIVAQSWSGETMGEFNLRTNQGWINGQQGVAEDTTPDDEKAIELFAQIVADDTGYDVERVNYYTYDEGLRTPSGIPVYYYSFDGDVRYVGALPGGKPTAIVNQDGEVGNRGSYIELSIGGQVEYIIKGKTLFSAADQQKIANAKPGDDEYSLVMIALDLMWGRMQHKFMEQGVAEGKGDFAQAIDNLSGWHEEESDNPDIRIWVFDDREGGWYAQGTVYHNVKTGRVKIEFEDRADAWGGDVNDTFDSIGDAMKVLKNITGQISPNTGKAQDFDKLGGRTVAGPDDLYKTDRVGKKGTLNKTRMDIMKAFSPYRKTGPEGQLPESGVAEATGDPKFDKMLKGITGKRQVAKQQKADTKQQARDAFGGMFGGGNPADSLGIRKKGVSEGADDIASAKERLAYLEKIFDTSYEYSDDHSVWKKHNEIRQEMDKLKKIIGQSVDEGSELPPNVIDMIKKIAQSSAAPDHKKAMINALIAKYSNSDVAETYGAELHTKHKKNRFKQIKKIKQTQNKAFGLSEAGCTMTEEGRECPMHGMNECPGYEMTETSPQDKLHQRHQEIRKKSGLPHPDHYLKMMKQKQAEIDALKADIAADRAKGLGEARKPDYNFDIEDIKKLERIKDLATLKTLAFELISKPSAKPMKPEKVEWFRSALERMDSPLKVIKLMYDLLLSGEGHQVIGSRNSMKANSYRGRFSEQDIEEGLRDPKDNPCWDGYKPVGTKKKAGKTVPNCVPTNEDIERYVEALSLAGYELQEEKTRLDPKCWKGKKIGNPKTKMKGGVRVNNCVPK